MIDNKHIGEIVYISDILEIIERAEKEKVDPYGLIDILKNLIDKYSDLLDTVREMEKNNERI